VAYACFDHALMLAYLHTARRGHRTKSDTSWHWQCEQFRVLHTAGRFGGRSTWGMDHAGHAAKGMTQPAIPGTQDECLNCQLVANMGTGDRMVGECWFLRAVLACEYERPLVGHGW